MTHDQRFGFRLCVGLVNCAALAAPATAASASRNAWASVSRNGWITSHVSSRFSCFESWKSLQIHICTMLKQFTNAYLHLSLHKKSRLQKSKVFERNIAFYGEAPESARRATKTRGQRRVLRTILLKLPRCSSKTPKKFRKTSRTPFGRTLRHLMSGVISIVFRPENHCNFIVAWC